MRDEALSKAATGPRDTGYHQGVRPTPPQTPPIDTAPAPGVKPGTYGRADRPFHVEGK